MAVNSMTFSLLVSPNYRNVALWNEMKRPTHLCCCTNVILLHQCIDILAFIANDRSFVTDVSSPLAYFFDPINDESVTLFSRAGVGLLSSISCA